MALEVRLVRAMPEFGRPPELTGVLIIGEHLGFSLGANPTFGPRAERTLRGRFGFLNLPLHGAK